MNDVRWTRGGRRGGRVPTAKTTHRTIRSSVLPRLWTSDFSVMETTQDILTSKKLAFKFSTSPHPPCVHSCDEFSQAFPVFNFSLSSDSVHYCERKGKIKTGEAWDRG